MCLLLGVYFLQPPVLKALNWTNPSSLNRNFTNFLKPSMSPSYSIIRQGQQNRLITWDDYNFHEFLSDILLPFSRVRLCDLMDCSTPGFPCPSPILRACSNSCPLRCPPAFNLSQHQGLTHYWLLICVFRYKEALLFKLLMV